MPEQYAQWDRFVDEHPAGHFTHTTSWHSLMLSQGWRGEFIAVKDSADKIVAGTPLFTKRILPAFPVIVYFPRGWVVDYADDKLMAAISAKADERARALKAMLAKADPAVDEEDANGRKAWEQAGYVKHIKPCLPGLAHPQFVFHLEYNGRSEEEIFDSFKREARKAIRKAAKQGIVIEKTTADEDFEAFYRIYRSLGEGVGFSYRPYSYVRTLWDFLMPANRAVLFQARHQNQIVASVLILYTAKKCWSLYGGMDRRFTELRASNLLYWEAIRWSLAQGHLRFSFRGVPGRLVDSSNEGYGLYKFKESFSPAFHQWIGTYHKVYRRYSASAQSRIESMLMRAHHTVRQYPRFATCVQKVANMAGALKWR